LNLFKIGVLNDSKIFPKKTLNEEKFWNSFRKSIDENIRGMEGKQKILSIIADQFTYEELKSELKVIELFSNYFKNLLKFSLLIEKIN
jgi:hypothetical protein